MKRRCLGFGLALLIGLSVAVTDAGVMQVSATGTSNTTGSSTTGNTTGSTTGSNTTANSTANNARFTVDGAELVVTENLNPNKYPTDFTETKVECKGKSYKGLKFKNADIQMICLLNQKTGVAAYYIYRDSDQSLAPFIKIESGNDYIIAMPSFMMEDTQAPEGYTQTELEFEKGKAQVYQAPDSTDSYLIYAMDKEGNKNWYEYNSQSTAFQVYEAEPAVEEVTQETETVETDTGISAAEQYQELETELSKVKTRYRLIIAVMLVIIVVLVVLLINTLLKRRDGMEYEEEDFLDEGDFYDEYEEYEEEVQKAVVEEPVKEDTYKEHIREEKEDTLIRETVVKKEKKEKKYESDIEVLDLNDL